MVGEDPNTQQDDTSPPTPDAMPGVPTMDTPPTAPTAPTGAPQRAQTQPDFTSFLPHETDAKAWDELKQDFEGDQTKKLDQYGAASLPETPEMGGTRRKTVKVISMRETSLNQMMNGSEGGQSMTPPAETSLTYDVRPGENEDAAFQRAMAAYNELDQKGLAQDVQTEADVTKYTAARAASQLTLGLSSVMPGVGTQDFERRFRAQYPDAVTPLEWTAAGAGMLAASVPGVAKALPLNWMWSGVRTAVGRPLRSLTMSAALRAGEGMKDVAMGWNQSLEGFMSSNIGKEVYQYINPKTIERFHDAWTAIGATAKDNIIRISESAAAAADKDFLPALRAFKAEATAAGWNAGTFRVIKVASNAAAGGAVGAADAIARTVGADTPADREHAHASIVPMAMGGLFVGGAFGLAESLYNAARAVHSPLPRVEPGAPEPSAPALELQQMRARQLESRMKDIR
jgi:hypothetical protein